jgi:hypothetical protein
MCFTFIQAFKASTFHDHCYIQEHSLFHTFFHMVHTTSLIAGTISILGLKIKDKRYKENVKKKGGEEGKKKV